MSTQQQATELHLRQLTNLLRRRWKLIMVSGLIGVTVACVAGWIIPPRYTAKAQIVIDPPKPDKAVGQPSTAGLLDDAAVETQVAMLVSDGHLQRVFESLIAEQKAASAENAPAFEAADIERLKRQIKAFKEHRSRVIGVAYTSTSPTTAAMVANRTVQLYLENFIERKRGERLKTLNGVRDHLTLVKAEVERADTALRNYRIKLGFTEASRTDTVGLQQRLATLQDASTEARQPEAWLRELQRQASTGTQLYESLLQRQKEMLLEWEDQPEVRVLSFASIPTLPSSLNPFLFVLPALALAFIGAGLSAVILERFNRGLRSEQDIKDALGIPCVGLIPKVTRRKNNLRPHEHLPKRPFAAYTEAIRSAAASALELANTQAAPKAFLVTSSVRSEGKTTLALSFAVYAALLERRVLFIDLDLRNPAMLREFSVAAANRNVDVLQSGRPLTELITTVPELGLDYLRVRHDSADPIAMLANALPDMLRELKERYDCVVIDTAPLLGTTEARLLASMVDKVLFVVKWGSTRREMAENALQLLWHFDSHLQNRTCAVVTQVDLKMHASYRHGDFGEALFNLESHPIARVRTADVTNTGR